MAVVIPVESDPILLQILPAPLRSVQYDNGVGHNESFSLQTLQTNIIMRAEVLTSSLKYWPSVWPLEMESNFQSCQYSLSLLAPRLSPSFIQYFFTSSTASVT